MMQICGFQVKKYMLQIVKSLFFFYMSMTFVGFILFSQLP